ncbi:hypothetical protein FQ377_04375 [Arthrobacter echini]|uniref:DUF5302 domain-containing protein n=1 Tax=Arthrobacter echini TaxID=1529066 RepID=A0A5D0XXB6_9MICC|nr:hypothetical protein [Arthrobacter echini]TYD00662.1 hypothetical protein FQ377_04375 [Arthrobacter echini]
MTRNDDRSAATGGTDESTTAAGETPASSVQDDPRARLALARKNHAANPTAATGAGHVKAAQQSAKQGKQERKVRW